MRIEGKDYTKKADDVMVIRLPDTAEPTFGERVKRAMGLSEAGFELSILPPTKRLYDELTSLTGSLQAALERGSDGEGFDIGSALETVAHLMSRNAERRAVTSEMLEDMGFDLEDVGEFIGSYIFFVNELVASKN